MKHIHSILFATGAALALAGCGGGAGNADDSQPVANAAAYPTTAASGSVAAEPVAAPTAPIAAPAAVATPAAASKAAPRPAGPGRFAAWTADEIAGGANANCVIKIPAGDYRGACKFTAEGGASFSVEHPNGYPLIGDVESFYLAADTRTVARLHGMDPVEGMQDYGVVNRPSTREACWGNATARICPYAK
ncbi:hypothetical protein [Sphingosinithalassobacter portus]|uniref:hypothetical protein n=1 Tax=Stakelama portus TaxID=2676234 RepID=UPI0018736AD1|nr:hypothetical protein [Sphingosinithalassobacter portus]